MKPQFEKTIQHEIHLEGVGIHTGLEAKLHIKPLGIGKGIRFRISNHAESEFFMPMDFAESPHVTRRSRIGKTDSYIETVEHLMSGIHGLGLTNLDIEIEGPEVPILDGSALEFVRHFQKAGIEIQNREREILVVREPIFVHSGQSVLSALPADNFRITYTMDYPHPMLRAQAVAFDINERCYLEEIAPCRTFCTEAEARSLQKQGFGLGANTSNTLVMGLTGPIRNTLRFPDECARHKVLDLIGDLGLLGQPIQAHIVAIRSGHKLNRRLLEVLMKDKAVSV